MIAMMWFGKMKPKAPPDLIDFLLTLLGAILVYTGLLIACYLSMLVLCILGSI